MQMPSSSGAYNLSSSRLFQSLPHPLSFMHGRMLCYVLALCIIRIINFLNASSKSLTESFASCFLLYLNLVTSILLLDSSDPSSPTSELGIIEGVRK